ncbi:MAG: hypothetical protein K2J23_02565 [Muribaculaceae bacterium]|nr:hypothetical protein [Muribaculaceae bacterium]MDE6836351.1 hypothetical protein [Muribaculaceae bacterium]MDE6866260.1 hypothetical protein [Muribaculaceae bacterium]
MALSENTYYLDHLYSKFIDRLESRPIITEDYYFDTRLLSDIFKSEESLQARYNELMELLFKYSKFKTSEGNFSVLHINSLEIDEVVKITDKNNEIHIVLNKQDEPINANSIEDIQLHITKDIKQNIRAKWNQLTAVPDLMVIIREVCPGVKCNTTYCNLKQIRESILDCLEARQLLQKMRFELLNDFRLITQDIEIYWD